LAHGGLIRSASAADEPTAAESAFFETEVRPLLAERCWGCHGDAKSPKGGLRLTSRADVLKGGASGPAAVPGKPGESLLVHAVRYQDEPKMPPKERMSDRQIEVLARWVERNLPWPGTTATPEPARPTRAARAVTDAERRFWAFQPIQAPEVPAVHDVAWAQTAVDRFILAGLEGRGLRPAPPADKRTLIRRATFDLVGLPPTPGEVDAFLADRAPDPFARVVDRLLASPRYGERWGRHWLDLVRYADARDLIQLPPESDFREAWRYRDWVVAAFNRDLPYPAFIRDQIAGDLVPAPTRDAINADGLVATGMLAIADFVPGDVDKDQMIADYVNDEIDVVGRAFLGLSLACARCHDHKFDPISTEDYYALAGIFFSTRLIPGPVAGNTPLVRVPLLPPAELEQIRAQESADTRRRLELEQQLPDAVDREFVNSVNGWIAKDLARYLVAASDYRRSAPDTTKRDELAKARGLDAKILAGWVEYLARVASEPPVARHPALASVASGRLEPAAIEREARALQATLAERISQAETAKAASPLDHASLLQLRADDPIMVADAQGRVAVWPNRAGLPIDATAVSDAARPLRVSAMIDGHLKLVLRFDGERLMEARRRAPPTGSLVVLFRNAESGNASQRLIGWEDSDVGRHGVGLMTDPGGRLHAILRNEGRSGDVVDESRAGGFQIACLTWGAGGTALYRNGKAVTQKTIESISSDPNIIALHVGGPGSGGGPRFRGDIAELRLYNRPLDEPERRRVEAELRETWFKASDPSRSPRDLVDDLYRELRSSRGPFWVTGEPRENRISAEGRARVAALSRELDALKKKPRREIPQAVVVQEGGPPGTRHEGFKDAPVYLRGNPRRTGKTVPRGFPRILTGGHRDAIKEGSGRRQLADWLGRPENPLTARVMVNRIWQHHFGEGLVRTPNDFGLRGERPTHPALLDELARRFVQAGWSIKAMHRLIMLSGVYQQSDQADARAAAADPENRLFGRMPARRLSAEAIRDSLLAVAGRLDFTQGGPAFLDLSVPRRTLYLSSARTGASTSDFGRLFDRADPGSIVDRRSDSLVAPQALFFMNDPFVDEQARALAARLAREVPGGGRPRIERLYALAFGRPPRSAETELGLRLIAGGGDVDPWARYCLIILASNEFLYVD
jgi:mono/diheme cytochrome c family protein